MKRNQENYVVKDACLSVVQTRISLPHALVIYVK